MSQRSIRSAGKLTRRSFLKTSASAVLIASAPAILRGDDADKVIVGEGAHKYEWVKGWGKLPDGKNFGNAHSAQVDSQGRVFIHNAGKDSVCIFDADGKFIKSWGPEWAGGAHGMHLAKEGNSEFLYLATTGQRQFVKTTLDGEVVWKHSVPAECAGYEERAKKDIDKGNKNAKAANYYSPTNTAVAPNGDVYVSDGYGSNFIHQYTKDGKYVRSWGGGGSEPGKMSCCHGLYCDLRGAKPRLAVADRSNERIQYFDLDGTNPEIVKVDLRHPCHFDQYKDLLLCPGLNGRVSVLDKNNKVVSVLGDNPDAKKRGGAGHGTPQAEWKDGIFHTPHGGCFDKDGNIYITEWIAPVGRVTKLKKLA